MRADVCVVQSSELFLGEGSLAHPHTPLLMTSRKFLDLRWKTKQNKQQKRHFYFDQFLVGYIFPVVAQSTTFAISREMAVIFL